MMDEYSLRIQVCRIECAYALAVGFRKIAPLRTAIGQVASVEPAYSGVSTIFADAERAVGAMSLLLMVALILVLLVIVGSSAMARAGRRRREMLEPRRRVPTASEDVWAMHQLPATWDDSPDNDTEIDER